jgi:hypothetical protein
MKADLIELLRAMRRAERDVFGALDPAVRDAPMREGDWSPKDHQAHLTAWKARHARRFAAAREGVELPSVEEGEETDELNAELRAERADWTWEAIDAEADEVSERLATEIDATDEKLIAGAHRLVGGTLGNGPFHAMSHFGWLVDAGIGMDEDRVRRFVDETIEQFRSSQLPSSAISNAIYNAACYKALHGDLDGARVMLRESFQLDPELIAWSKQDSDLVMLRDELDALAGTPT